MFKGRDIRNDWVRRSGLARRSDLSSPLWKNLYHDLLTVHDQFNERGEQIFSANYRWPRDPLHTWSRIWEYPYVLWHSRERYSQRQAPLKVADVGSGATFFPFTLARDGHDVACFDVDPECGRCLENAVSAMPAARGSVTFKIIDGTRLPIADGTLDLVYSISVLEHLSSWSGILHEIHRALVPGGRLVLTVDLDLRGDAAISSERFLALQEDIANWFVPIVPERVGHPRDLLTSRNSLYPLRQPVRSMPRRIASSVVSRIMETPTRFATPAHLAVFAGVYQKL